MSISALHVRERMLLRAEVDDGREERDQCAGRPHDFWSYAAQLEEEADEETDQGAVHDAHQSGHRERQLPAVTARHTAGSSRLTVARVQWCVEVVDQAGKELEIGAPDLLDPLPKDHVVTGTLVGLAGVAALGGAYFAVLNLSH